jgi:hypothetical protein
LPLALCSRIMVVSGKALLIARKRSNISKTPAEALLAMVYPILFKFYDHT